MNNGVKATLKSHPNYEIWVQLHKVSNPIVAHYKGGEGQKEGRKRYYCEMWNIKIDKMAKVVFQGNMISTDYIGFHILFYSFFFLSFFAVAPEGFKIWWGQTLKFN